MTPMSFKELRDTVVSQREAVLRYMPVFGSRNEAIVDSMSTPGTPAYALMTSICAMLADEMAHREWREKQVTE